MHDYLDGTETFARENPNIFNPHSLTMNGIDTYEDPRDRNASFCISVLGDILRLSVKLSSLPGFP